MPEDPQGQDLSDQKIEQYEKKKEFNKKLNDAIGASLENKEEITGIKGKIDDLTKKICEGPDCLEDQIKGVQKGLEELKSPTFTCVNCGYDGVPPLSSYCSNCGYPIKSWKGEDGKPIPGWRPFPQRIEELKGKVSQTDQINQDDKVED